MVVSVYAVAGTDESDRTGVAVDLAGAFAARGDDAAVVDLAGGAGGPGAELEVGESLAADGVSIGDEALAGAEAGVVPATVRVDGPASGVGVVPAAGDGPPDLEGLAPAVERLDEGYDVLVLSVEAAAGADLGPVGEVTTEALVTTGPDEAAVGRAGDVLEALDEAGITVSGVVLTGSQSSARGWRAKSRLDPPVVATLPPVDTAPRRDYEAALWDLVDELLVGDVHADPDREDRVTSLRAAVADGREATVVTDGPGGPGETGVDDPVDGEDGAGDWDAQGADERTGDGDPDDGDDPDGDGGRGDGNGPDGGDVEFEAIPAADAGETGDGGDLDFGPVDATGGDPRETGPADPAPGPDATGDRDRPVGEGRARPASGGEDDAGPGGDSADEGVDPGDGDEGRDENGDEGRDDDGEEGRDGDEDDGLATDGDLVDRVSDILGESDDGES